MSLPSLTPEAQRSIRTIGGAITYTIRTYHGEVLEMHRDFLCYHLGISTNEPYCVESTGYGFKYTCKYFEFAYKHDDYSAENRKITFTEFKRET